MIHFEGIFLEYETQNNMNDIEYLVECWKICGREYFA